MASITIDEMNFFAVHLLRKKAFNIATGSSSMIMPVLVKVSQGGLVGWGAGSPNSVTGETPDSISKALRLFSDKLAGRSFDNISDMNAEMDSIVEGNPAAKAAVDMALWDLAGKSGSRPVCELLGRVRESQLTDMTLGIESAEDSVTEAGIWQTQGFRAFKIKVGLDIEADVARVRKLRDALGQDIRLWADANQGYTVAQALEFADAVADINIEFIEQPVASTDLAGLGEVRENSPVPIMADESVRTKEDALAVINGRCADMINIKLMKCGGITRAREIASICDDAGIPNMIGCMGESSVSIAGALHFALAERNVQYADLDSHFMLRTDIASGLDFIEGCLYPSSKPGLGLEINDFFSEAF